MSRGLLTIMATVTHLGLIVSTIGLLFYVTDHDVIVEEDAGTLLGPAMVLASMACVFFGLARAFGVAERDRVTSRILGPSVVAAAASFVAMLVVGSVGYAFVRGEAVWLILFAGRYAGSAFVIASSAWAGLVVAGSLLVSRADTAPRV